jgi:hypothetical protein
MFLQACAYNHQQISSGTASTYGRYRRQIGRRRHGVDAVHQTTCHNVSRISINYSADDGLRSFNLVFVRCARIKRLE